MKCMTCGSSLQSARSVLPFNQDSAVDHGPFRHSRVLEAGIQEVRNAWMPASAGMTPFSLRPRHLPILTRGFDCSLVIAQFNCGVQV